jgi:hypothetical protein
MVSTNGELDKAKLLGEICGPNIPTGDNNDGA